MSQNRAMQGQSYAAPSRHFFFPAPPPLRARSPPPRNSNLRHRHPSVPRMNNTGNCASSSSMNGFNRLRGAPDSHSYIHGRQDIVVESPRRVDALFSGPRFASVLMPVIYGTLIF